MTVGFIGLGRMGSPIARNLCEAGFEDLLLYNRTRSKMEEFVKSNTKSRPTDSPSQLIECDLVFTMLSDAAAVEDVLFSPDSGLLSHVKNPNKKPFIIDMSTIGPSQSVKIALKAQERGARFLDAPVSGGPKAAKEKQLVVFIGGQKELYDEVASVFPSFSKKQFYLGRNGMGCFMKLITVVNLTCMLLGLSESFALGKKAGINKDLVIEILNSTASNRSGLSESKGPTMAKEDFTPTFTLKQMSKDLGLVETACQELRLPLRVSSTITDLYQSAVEHGYGDLDFSAIQAYEEELAGIC